MTFDKGTAHGCTTESLRWADADYEVTAGTIWFRPTTQADSSAHLFFVDVCVTTVDGREIVLERVEGGKALHCLLEAEQDAQGGQSGRVVHDVKARRLP